MIGDIRTENTISPSCILDNWSSLWLYVWRMTLNSLHSEVPSGLFTGTTETWAIVTSGWTYNTEIHNTAIENPKSFQELHLME